MAESQQDIDSLLAEVSTLADEAIAGIGTTVAAGESTGEPRDNDPKLAAAEAECGHSRSPGAPPDKATASHETASRPADANVKRILNLEVPVIVRLAERTLPMSEILNLSTGAIVEFNKPVDSQLHLLINNKCIGHGQAVKVGENFGLRVTHIGSVRERIQALGE